MICALCKIRIYLRKKKKSITHYCQLLIRLIPFNPAKQDNTSNQTLLGSSVCQQNMKQFVLKSLLNTIAKPLVIEFAIIVL